MAKKLTKGKRKYLLDIVGTAAYFQRHAIERKARVREQARACHSYFHGYHF